MKASYFYFTCNFLSLFLLIKGPGPKSPFKELDMKAPIREQLANVIILEFPVLHVFLPSHSVNFEVVKPVNPLIHKPLQKDCDGAQSPKGIPFREEEIEDDDNSSPNPHIFDLMKHLDSELSHQMPIQNKSSEKALNYLSSLCLKETQLEIFHILPRKATILIYLKICHLT